MLKIQEHLKLHGLEATVEKFKLNTKDLGHKIMFKYDQLNSSNVHEEVKECRGLVLAKDTWEIISMPFRRFYNYTDYYADSLDSMDDMGFGFVKILLRSIKNKELSDKFTERILWIQKPKK